MVEGEGREAKGEGQGRGEAKGQRESKKDKDVKHNRCKETWERGCAEVEREGGEREGEREREREREREGGREGEREGGREGGREMDETMKTRKEEMMRKSAPCLPCSLNRNMIHSERVGAERKRNHRRREGESRSNR